MDNPINIRLASVTFGSRNAVVTFRLYSDGHTGGEQSQTLVDISHEVPRFTKEQDIPDYDRIVGEAATKMVQDFQRIIEQVERLKLPGE